MSEQDKITKNQREEHLKARIDRFSVKGFRSLKDVGTISLPDLAVIIGSNGAGKSNCIKFFEMLSFMLRSQNLSEFVARNGGADDQLFMGARRTPRMEAEIRIETSLGFNDYKFALTHAASIFRGRPSGFHWTAARLKPRSFTLSNARMLTQCSRQRRVSWSTY